MTFGEAGKEGKPPLPISLCTTLYRRTTSILTPTSGARVYDTKGVEAILDVFQKHGHTEIDTARVYTGGTSEEYLGKIDWRARGLKLETKLYPTAVRFCFTQSGWC